MQLINGRSALALLNLSLLLAPSLAVAAPTDPYLVQIHGRNEVLGTSVWKRFWDSLRGKPVRAADLLITVSDPSGQPLSGTSVLVGQRQGDPFPGNLALTDSSGTVSFTNEALRNGRPLSVTAALNGYTTVSLLESRANTLRIVLQKQPDERGFGFLRGKVNGIPKLGNSAMELGLFIPAARPETFLNFDIQSFVSSYIVKVNIYGERDIPGNVVLPTQTKYWGIVPINLSKPDFVMPLPTGMTTHMYGVAGGIPISSAVNAVQNKDFLELLNLTNLTSVGWTRDRVEVRGNDNFDLNLTRTISPNQITAAISNVPAKLDVVSVSLVDPSGDKGDFVAMDVKSLKAENIKNGSGSLRLGQIKSNRKEGFYVFSAIFDRALIDNSNSRSVVGSVQPVRGRANVPFARFLNPIRPVGVAQGNREFRFSNPANGSLSPNLLIVNIVSEKNNAETMGVTRTVLWSAVLQGSAEKVELPDLGRPVLPAPDAAKGEKFHWEVTGLRTAPGKNADLNLQESLRDLQDVSTLQQAF